MNILQKSFYPLCIISIMTYLAVVVIGVFMPLQTDEVGWMFLHDRAFIDNSYFITLFPQCGKDLFATKLPWMWYLPAYFNHLTYANIDNPIWVRIGGIIHFAIWLVLWVAIAIKLFAIPRKKWWVALAIMLGFLGFNAMPLMFLVNRPEQILCIMIGIFIILAIYADDISKSNFWRIICSLLLIFAVMYLHYSHPKSIALLPFELLTGGIFLHKIWKKQIVTLAGEFAIFWIGVESYLFNLKSLQCPGSADVRENFAFLTLSISDLWLSPFSFLQQAWKNFFSAIHKNGLRLRLEHDGGDWIPYSLHPVGKYLYKAIKILDSTAKIILICLLLYAMLTASYKVAALIRKNGGYATKSKDDLIPLSILCTLLLTLIAFFTLLYPMFYATAINIPLVLMVSLLALRLTFGKMLLEKLPLAKFVIILLICAIINQIILIDRYAAFISEPELHETKSPNRQVTYSPLNYEQKKDDIIYLSKQCNISLGPEGNHVVMDDMTYHALRHTSQPFHISYTIFNCCKDVKATFTPKDYFKFLNDYGSDGIIAECANFMDSLLPYTIQKGSFCCISKDKMQNP